MALPSFTLTGNLKEIVSDVDTGELTEAVLSRASIVFESNVGSDTLITWEDTAYAVEAIVGRIDTTGAIVNIDGDPLELLAQDDGLNVTGLQWRVTITIPTSSIPPLARKQIRPFWIDAPNDGDTVDLAEVLPVPGLAIQGVTPLTRTSLLGLIEDSASDVHDAIVDASGAEGSNNIPSYVAGARSGFYDPSKNAYNWKASNTHRLKASLGKAMSGIGGAQHWIVIGDSIPAGYMGTGASPTWEPTKAWPRVMRASLAAQGIPVAGTGLVPTSDQSQLAADSRWTASASGFGASGVGYAASTVNASTMTFTSDTAGTQVDVYYYGAGGAFTVNIDGLGDVTPTAGGSVIPMKYTVTGLANTTHTVVITASNTTNRYIIGASVSGATSGLVTHNLALGSSQSGTWSNTAAGSINNARIGSLALSSITPSVVFIELGANDYLNSITAAAFKTNITTLRTQFSTSDVVLVACPASLAFFIEEHYDLADSLDVPLIDSFDRYGGLGSGAPGNANGLVTDSSNVHPNQAMHADWGRAIAGLVAA